MYEIGVRLSYSYGFLQYINMEVVKPVEPVLWACNVKLVMSGTGYGTVEALLASSVGRRSSNLQQSVTDWKMRLLVDIFESTHPRATSAGVLNWFSSIPSILHWKREEESDFRYFFLWPMGSFPQCPSQYLIRIPTKLSLVAHSWYPHQIHLLGATGHH